MAGRAICRSLTFALVLLVLVSGMTACSSSRTPQKQQPPSATLENGRQLYEAGKFGPAEKVLSELLKDSPDDLGALSTLALTLAAQGKNEQAIAQYSRIVELEPKDHATWYRMALLERIVGDTKAVEAHLKKAVSLKADDPSYTDELARTEMQLGKYAEAAKLWGKVLAKKGLPKEGRKELLVLQGQAYQAAKDDSRAREAFSEALALDPKDKALQHIIESLD